MRSAGTATTTLAALLVAACAASSPGDLRVDVVLGAGVPRPDYLQVSWFTSAGPPIERRVPEAGYLEPGASPLASLVIERDASKTRERRILVSGLDGSGVRVALGARRVPSIETAVTVTLEGDLPDSDGDGLPDAIDDEPCAAKAPSCAPGDGGASADGGPSTARRDATSADRPALDQLPIDQSVSGAPGDAGPLRDASPAATADGAPPAPDAPLSGLAAGLVGYWKLDEASGATSARDSSSFRNDGVLRGSDPSTAWVAGRKGRAFAPQGKGWIEVPASSSIDRVTRPLSYAAWIYRAAANTRIEAIFARQLKTTNAEHFSLFIDVAGKPAVYMNDPIASDTVCIGRSALPLARWVHLAVTVADGTGRIYVDGAEACAGPTMAQPQPTTPVAIGANFDDGTATPKWFCTALIDEVLLFSRALTAAEVARLAAGESPP